MKRFLLFFFTISTSLIFGQSTTKISSDAAIADLNESVSLIEAVHYNPYLYKDSVEFHLEKELLIEKFRVSDSISINGFIIDVKQLIATLNDGHTTLSVLFPQMMDGHFFPADILANIEQGELFQIADGTNSNILSINGENAFSLFEESMTLYGGNRNFRKAMSESILFPIFLYLKDINPPFEMVYADGRKDRIETGIDIRTLANRQGGNSEDYSFKVIEEEIGYLAYNKCNNVGAFKKFLKATFADIEEQNIEKLIIDIRENTGGTSSLNDLLIPYFSRKEYRQSSSRYWRISDEFKSKINDPIYSNYWGESFVKQYLASRTNTVLKEDEYGLTKPKKTKHYFDGKSCMLIGSKTFSSANFLADAVSTYNLTTLIGSDTGEDTNDFGEQISFILLETGLTLQVTLAFDIGADGNSEKLEPVHADIETESDALQFAIEWLQKSD